MLLLIAVVFNHVLSAQNTFNRVDTIPVTENSQLLRNPWTGGINFPNINSIDLNGDGLKDLMLFDRMNNRIVCFLNNGSTNYNQAWDYAPQYNSQFPPVRNWALLYDYNCDGKEDFFTLSETQNGIKAYRNDATGSTLNWTLADSVIKEDFAGNMINVFASGVSLPAFTDIDADGDMDILGYNTLPDGRVAWHKNLSKENFNHCDSLKFVFASACWGDFTLRIGGSNSVGCFSCPCRYGRPSAEFEAPSSDQSEAAQRDDTISGICPIDIDGDQDIDLLVGDIASTNSLLIVNGGSTATANMVSQDIAFPSYDTPAEFNGFHYHSYMDADNDGVKDLIVYPNEFENTKGLWLYKNVGTTAVPLFHFETNAFLQNNTIEMGEVTTPTLVDYDGDGLLDIVSGSSVYVDTSATYSCSLHLYKNTGTADVPSFRLITADFAGLSTAGYSFMYPAFGDLDGDGDMDMIIGNNVGNLAYYTNSAGAGNPMNLSLNTAQYFNIDVGNFSTPQLYDLDKDGRLDLLIGEKSGFVNYFKNTGTVTAPVFSAVPDNDTLGCIVRQPPLSIDGYTVPFAFDSLGKTRLIIADMQGEMDQYVNVDGNLNGCFTNAGQVIPQESSRIKFNVSVSGGDLNNDGYTDLIVGHSTGGLQIYFQYNPFASIASMESVKPSFIVYPNPAQDHLRFQFFNLKQDDAVLRIFDCMGRMKEERNVGNGEISLAVSDWIAGNYLIQLISSRGMTTSKVSIAH